MIEFRFDFANEQQCLLYERFRAELQAWPWAAIESLVAEEGEYRLGLTGELQPAYPADPTLDLVSEPDQRAAWLFALVQIVLVEEHLCLSHRPDPASGADTLWVTPPFAAAWQIAPRPRRRSTKLRPP
jgi:hypothetical protein